MRPLITSLLILLSYDLFSQTPCENGMADIYPCENIDFWTHMTPSEFGNGTTNEVWGWTDPLDGKEYVILGKSSGVAFIDIEDPANPLYLGTLPTHTVSSLWRTFRIFNNYLFVGSEANGHGLQVFDLTKLRNVSNPPTAFAADAHYSGFGRCHTLVIHEETGMLYACGTNTYSGGLHVVNINNPLQPVIAGGYNLDGYTHEAQVVTYNGPDQDYQGDVIVFCYNGNNPANLTIVNASDPTDITTVSITGYPNSSYCHQGWLTADGKHILMNDELDEYNGLVGNTRTLVWDVNNLDSPVYMGDFVGPTAAIDHNLYILDNLCYQSNYTAGLRILDVTGVENLDIAEVAYFDHYLNDNLPTFDGTWMHYPYFASGIVPVSDIDNGLFLVEPNFLHVAPQQQSVPESETAYFQVDVSEGWSGPIALTVEGLPAGFDVVWSENNIDSPQAVVLSITCPENSEGVYNLIVNGVGAFNDYRREVTLTVTPVASFCADLNNDNIVGGADLVIFYNEWNCTTNCIADINGDGEVSIEDFLVLINSYGENCLD